MDTKATIVLALGGGLFIAGVLAAYLYFKLKEIRAEDDAQKTASKILAEANEENETHRKKTDSAAGNSVTDRLNRKR